MNHQVEQGEGTSGGTPDGSPQRLADHLVNCRKVDAAVVVNGSADDLVAQMIAAGWTYEGAEYVEGKRVRYLVPPGGVLLHPIQEGETR